MGGRVLSGAPWGRRTNHLLRAVAIAAVTTLLPLAAPAGAAHAATPIVPTDSGLTEPAGVAVTPDGAIWVSDAVNGLCRVADRPDASGSRLVRDGAGYCAPEVEVPEGQEPPGPARPSASFQIAFDADGCELHPATQDRSKCNFYVAEGTSHSSGIWRMHWNPETREIDGAKQIYAARGDNRVFGVALSPEGDVDFSSKRDNIIRRLSDPGAADFFSAAEAIGFSTVEGVPSLAHLGQALILADATGLARIDAPGPQGGLAVPVGGAPAGTTVGAVAADAAEGVVYAGTSNGKLTDAVLTAAIDGFADEPYETGFANVTALGVESGGALLIAHDPTAALSPGVDTIGFAELFARAAGPRNAPRVTLTATPQPAQRSGEPADTTFRFVSRAGADFSCLLDGQPVGCAAGAGGEGSFTPAGALAEGPHEFEAWAATAVEGSGPPARWHFEIDRTAPDVSIDAPTSRTAVGGALRVHFSSNERSATYECALDDADPAPCSPAKDLRGLALGDHTFSVRAIDAAGNASDLASWEFTAVPAPRADDPAPRTGTVAGPKRAVGAIRVQASRRPRAAAQIPCVEVAPGRGRAAYRLTGARARVRFAAPARARYAKVTLRRAGGRARARVIETLGYARVRSGSSPHVTAVTLTRGQRRAVRGGRTALAIAYGTCRTQVGPWQWLQTANQEGSR